MTHLERALLKGLVKSWQDTAAVECKMTARTIQACAAELLVALTTDPNVLRMSGGVRAHMQATYSMIE